MSTQFLPEIPLSKIGQHPANPRHEATADAELVESVKTSGLLQPLVVAPATDVPSLVGKRVDYVLIAGHRRYDALKKTKAKTAPAILRTDLVTEGQQVEAMLIENGRRADLSPVEEAEGYHQLELLGYTPKKIADAVGRHVDTVKSRLKLLTLSVGTQKKVHAGQYTLDEAAAFTEFADDPDASKRLEKAAKDGQLKYAITRERQTRERLQRCHVTIAALVDAGAVEYPMPEGKNLWQVDGIKIVRHSVGADGADYAADHDGCFGYVADLGGTWPCVHAVCINPGNHKAAEEPDADAAEQAQSERDRQERMRAYDEERAEKAAAARTRGQTVLDLFGTDTRMPPALRDVVRALLPTLMYETAVLGTFPALYFDLVGVPADDQWDTLPYAGDGNAAATRFAQHVEDIDSWSDGTLTRALVAWFVAVADANGDMTDDYGPAEKLVISRYMNLLTEAGHEFCEHDNAIRDAITAEGEGEPEQEAS